MLSSISLKKKDEFLLPETIETPMENQEDPGTGVKITSTKTKTKKKKFLKSFLCGASSVLRLVLRCSLSCSRYSPDCAAEYFSILTFTSRTLAGFFWWPTLPAPEDGTRPRPGLQALHQAMGGYEHDL